MSSFCIQGGNKLQGSVTVSGMKNAATPIIAATLLTADPCRIRNVPRITDVARMIEILQSLGAVVEWSGEHELTIQARDVNPATLATHSVAAMRSSVLFLGPMLARFREAQMPEPGGCIIGNRPIDTHLAALAALGAEVRHDEGHVSVRATVLRGATIILPEFSVTATENAMMTAVLAVGRTVIRLAAAEPHVQDLASFLRAMGAHIVGDGTHTITIDGVERLHGAEHAIIPDCIEAGTFLVAAAVTRGRLDVVGVVPEHLHAVLALLRAVGVSVDVGERSIRVSPGGTLHAFRLQTMPYPGFPTDLQAPFGLLATACNGTSLIHDPLYEGRMGYVQELVKMGASAEVCDPHRVLISGPTPLYGKEIKSLDLRAGATLLLAGLAARGESVLHDAEILDRGYERIDERLRELGADVVRE
jgi:UDP-N-acetylglucosamine 1-carboxyvinyltransferase